MSRQKTVTLYRYEELDERAQERALEWAREHRGWQDWDTEDLTEQMKQDLEDRGYVVSGKHPISWSLSYSQGDGVCFDAAIDLKIVAKRLYPEAIEALDWAASVGYPTWANVNGEERYYTCDLDWSDITDDIDIEDLEEGEALAWTIMVPRLQRLRELVEADMSDTQSALERLGYAEIAYRDSEKYLKESMKANEDEFDEDGNPA